MPLHPQRGPAVLAGILLAACGQPGLESIADPSFYDPEPGVLRMEPSVAYDFGAVSPQASRIRGEVLMYVEGQQPVTVDEVYLTDTTSLAFSLPEQLPQGLTLEPGDEAVVGLFFEPYAVGDYFGDFVVLTRSAEGQSREFLVELEGVGCEDLDADGACD